LRSPLGKVLGLGSANHGTDHWWMQRVSAIALVPLTLWFVISLLRLPALDYDTLRLWARVPVSGLLSSLLIVVAAYHGYLGTTVIVEDYVTQVANRVLSLLVLRFAYVLCASAAVFAVLRLSFGFSSL
jgi:succinate dehydrogenase / fumarate reductase membrane anchor subunit